MSLMRRRRRRPQTRLLVEALEPRLAPALVAAYAFDEGSGTTLHDISGNANNGTVSNATWVTTGKYGGALQFSGSLNSWVTVNDSPSLDLTGGMTLEAWVNPSSLASPGAGWDSALSKEHQNAGTDIAYALYAATGSGTPPAGHVLVGGSDYGTTAGAVLPLNTWTFLTATYDGTTLSTYVNGALADTTAVGGNITVTHDPLRIGGDWSGEMFTGLLDNIRVYNTALTPAQIQADMGAPIGGDTQPPTAPTNLAASGGIGTAALTWTASTDNVGVTQYNVYRSTTSGFTPSAANKIGTSTTTAYTDHVAAGTYYYLVTAQDAAGNVSQPSNQASAVVQADTIPPTVSLTSPANGATVSGTITVTATASDNVGVVGVQFLLDGNNLGAEVTTAPYSVSWSSTGVADGTHTLGARARDAAGNTATSTVTVTVLNSPANLGQWSAVINMPNNPVTGDPVVPMHLVLLDNGKLLFWDGGPACLGAVSPTVWDPVAGTFTAVPLENQTEVRDLFCSAPTALANGDILVAGGHDCTSSTYIGTAIANLFDPSTNKWTFLPDMHDRRWYPDAKTLPDGRVLVTAGSATSTTDYDPIPEIYDPVSNTWTKLTGANQTIANYPFIFDLPDGRVLAAGSDESLMATYALNVATQTWTTVDPTVLDAGSAVMYLPGKIMKAGSSYLSAPTDNGGSTPSKATTYVLDMTQASPAWKQTASMAFPRTHLNLTLLPDGTVLATGGSTDIGGVNTAHAVYAAELWSPTTDTWSTLSSEQVPRLYHSTAMLLPDGRVVVAGGGHNYFNNLADPNAEIYSPPYLFKGARPTVTSAPATLAYGSSFFVGTPDAATIASVTLIRNGADTHAFNMGQAYVPLTFTQTSGGLTVQAPANANLAAPGYYMLFIVNSKGVPCVAPFVRLATDTQPPTAPTNLTATVAASTATLSWTASTDNVGVLRYDVYRSTTSGFTPSAATLLGTTATTSYTDAPGQTGTFYYLVTAEDFAGNVSAPSNQATAMISASPSLVAAYGFSEGSGTTTADSSGHNNTGTITDAAWTTAGKFGDALRFNGNADSYVTVNDSASLDVVAAVTVEAWVNPASLNSAGAGWCAAVAKEHQNSGNDIAYALYAAQGTGTGPAFHVLVNGSDYGAGAGPVLPLNAWTFLAGTYDGTTLSVYVNGALAGSIPVGGAITVTHDPLRIGGDWSGEMFTGVIDNVRVYNTALTPAQIQADMSAALGNTPLAPAPAFAAVGAPTSASRTGNQAAQGASPAFPAGPVQDFTTAAIDLFFTLLTAPKPKAAGGDPWGSI